MPNPVDKNNLDMYDESTYQAQIDVLDTNNKAVNISGYTAVMQIRTDEDSQAILYEGTTSDHLSIVNTNETDEDGSDIYAVEIKIPGDVIGDWTFSDGVYDLFVIDGNSDPFAVSRGNVKVYPGVTVDP